jgi:hypothetical protein
MLISYVRAAGCRPYKFLSQAQAMIFGFSEAAGHDFKSGAASPARL